MTDSPTSVPTPSTVLRAMLRSDSARPRVTFYDDATGERIELSARVLANWVAKAANLLQDDLDGAPATTVGLDLSAHWRACYWALATWAVGATLVLGPEALEADVLVTSDPGVAADEVENRLVVLVTPAMLARSSAVAVPDAVDEARDLATYPDVFEAWEEPGGTAVALRTGTSSTPYGDPVSTTVPRGARARVPDDLTAALTTALQVWAADGSVVLVHRAADDQAARLAAEGVTLDLAESSD